MNKIPFFLVTGFLGSGKTTLLKRIVTKFSDNKKIAIVQNEFAAASIDGAELKNTNKSFEIMEVNRGSVFCVCLLSDFIASLSEFIDTHQPEVIFLEASGLADPIAIGEMLEDESLKQKIYLTWIWTIVDASSFLQMQQLTRINHQIRVADQVIINKTDQSDDRKEIEEKIITINPFAKITYATYCQIDLETIFQPPQKALASRQNQELTKYEAGGRPDINTGVLRTSKQISIENLKAFLQEVIPNTIRLKGFVKLTTQKNVMVQSSFGKINITSLENAKPGPTEIIAMGQKISARILSKTFKKYTEN